jgi:citrate lyase beta subunit
VEAEAHSIMLSHAYSASDVTLAEGCLYSFAPARKVEILIEVDTPGILADLDIIARTSTAVTGLSVAAYDFALGAGGQTVRSRRYDLRKLVDLLSRESACGRALERMERR